ncbi:MAG: redoxin domain-containing protein [Bacteroidetes bacterium]|nr:redoxin domain-containing protein [Bacteroidota bacterium]
MAKPPRFPLQYLRPGGAQILPQRLSRGDFHYNRLRAPPIPTSHNSSQSSRSATNVATPPGHPKQRTAYPAHGAATPYIYNMKLLCHLLLACATLLAFPAQAQDQKELPYQKYLKLPAFNLVNLDSSEVINLYYAEEGKPTVLFFFSPDCEHCQITTDSLMAHMAHMQEANFYFMTFMPLALLRPFALQHQFSKYKNIITGKDYQFFFPRFYGATTVPYLVIYDKHKNFVKLYDGTIHVAEIRHRLDSLATAP